MIEDYHHCNHPLQLQYCLWHPVFAIQPLTSLHNQLPPLIQPGQVPQLNWSHFKLEFIGKPDEDVEVHLLRTNDWMNTHVFHEAVKVQRFCLTLV